ncbi:MAG: hypothetical protein FWD31_00730 [Planctomycetaceae bacterium]|nr:hypothetical protein [Planctomycetaceae bacterium]
MTSTEKVRARTKRTSKVAKKNVATGKTPVAKTSSDGRAAATKSVRSKTVSKAAKKSGQAEKKMKSSQKASVPAKSKETVGKTIKDKRKKRTLSRAEYDAFVDKAAKKEQVASGKLVTVDRRKTKRPLSGKPAVKSGETKERRQKVQRRRQIDPTTCERDYSQDEIEFMNALDEYKRNSGRMFPTCSEILEVFRGLGYMKQSQEDGIEIRLDPESGDASVTVTETGSARRDDDQRDDGCAGDESVSSRSLSWIAL